MKNERLHEALIRHENSFSATYRYIRWNCTEGRNTILPKEFHHVLMMLMMMMSNSPLQSLP